MTLEASARQRHILRNTLLVGVSFALAAGAGLVRNAVIGHLFGIGADLDAYYAAFKLPDLLFTIVAGGALATAFIPVFADFLADDDRAGAWRLASALTNLVVLVVSGLHNESWDGVVILFAKECMNLKAEFVVKIISQLVVASELNTIFPISFRILR